MSKVDVNLIAI